MNERRFENRYSSGLSNVMMLRADDALISSSSAASVVVFPLPVGPDTTTSPEWALIRERKSGCRLQARRSLTEGLSSRMAMAYPRIVRYRLIRQLGPPTTSDRSADPRCVHCSQAGGPSSSCVLDMT